jgi:ribosomal protein L22
MSADEEKDVPGEAPEEPKAARKAPAKKAPAEKKPAAKKAAAKKPAAEKPAAEKPVAAKADKPARKAAPKAAKEPSAEKPAAAQAEAAAGAETEAQGEKPPAKRARKPARKAAAAKEPQAEAKEAPKRRRGREERKAPRRRVVRARARYVRTSARKARMVCGHLRGKSVQEARAILAFTPREVAGDWRKLLESAVANAESNHELLEDDLIVREAYADEGPTIKRFRPRAMGRATPIRKRTSHLTIALSPRPEGGSGKRNG